MSTTPIADHALLSDCHSCALVDSAGSVEWLTFPRFDSPAVFARLLDDDAGHWSIRPTGELETSRRYLDDTMVLETTFRSAAGTVVLTDAMAMGPDNAGHELGRDAPHVLVRSLSCTDGTVDIEVSYAPRPEYGLIVPLLSAVEGGVTARGGAEWLVLSSPVRLAVEYGTGTGQVQLAAGDTVHFGLQRSTLGEAPARVWSAEELAGLLAGPTGSWRSWTQQHQAYEGPWANLVHTSGRVLQALTYQPSGAIVAAATTSLPEGIGGERNWDYRYSWVRDASLSMEALWVAACPDEASDFFAFMTTAAASAVGPDQTLQIMFGVGGEHDLSERTLPHLSGWRDSRPVRVGNGAWNQKQLDVYGELLGAAHRLVDQLTDLDDDTKRFLVAVADAAAGHWRDKGHGDLGGARRPAGVHLLQADVLGRARPGDRHGRRHRRWPPGRGLEAHPGRDLRHRRAEGLERLGRLVHPVLRDRRPGCLQPDAADRRVPAGRRPAHPRHNRRRRAGTDRVYRYHTEGGVDGLAGDEGTFLLCTFWLAQALATVGQVDRARVVFERAAAYVNDLGLLAEEVHPDTGELLGNFPQAFSHIGLVNAAWAIFEAERRAAKESPPDEPTG